MSKFIIVFYMATLSFAHWAWGSQCLTIKGELKQMQLAHVQITKNLLDNYRMSSEQVSYTATRMHSDSPARRLYVRDQALRSAKAHKKRVEKSEVILNKLSKAIDELVKKTANCIR